MSGYRGRFAPSPTGDLHLGSAATALLTWLRARSVGGTLVMRVEDIDTPRVVPGAEERQLEDLRWLGLDWDEGPDVGGAHGPYRQSDRHEHYERALARLTDAGHTFRCDCSRREIAVASAPHDGEDGPRYPGTCRPHGMVERPVKRPPATRLAVPPQTLHVEDRLQGPIVQDVATAIGDFVLRRGDGIWAYQLAVVVDDLAMGVTEVVRGADLLGSTPRQVLLAGLLGGQAPTFAHVPMLVDAEGGRLAKRLGGRTIRQEREAGARAAESVGRLAHLLGLRPTPAPVTPPALLADFDPAGLAGVTTIAVADE